jgi:hypothetical protein
MAERQRTARKQSRSERDDDERSDADRNAAEDSGGAVDEQELASYLEERIKPGLNRGSIPLLARSIAREIAQDQYRDEDDDGGDADTDDADDADDDGPVDLESDLHELQRRLGEDWTLYFAVRGDESWLTAEKDDVSQRIEAQDAGVLVKAVKLLSTGGGRSKQRDADD